MLLGLFSLTISRRKRICQSLCRGFETWVPSDNLILAYIWPCY